MPEKTPVRYVLTTDCPDTTGVVAAIAGFLAKHNALITEAQHFDDEISVRSLTFFEVTTSPSRFFSAPARAPHTVCGCQPVAAQLRPGSRPPSASASRPACLASSPRGPPLLCGCKARWELLRRGGVSGLGGRRRGR